MPAVFLLSREYYECLTKGSLLLHYIQVLTSHHVLQSDSFGSSSMIFIHKTHILYISTAFSAQIQSFANVLTLQA